jgi:hypothetical protein
MRIPLTVVISVLVLLAGVAHAETWCERDAAAIDAHLEALARPDLLRLAKKGLLGSCEPGSETMWTPTHPQPSRDSQPPVALKLKRLTNSRRNRAGIVRQRHPEIPDLIKPTLPHARQLLQQGPVTQADVNNATLALLRQAFAPICTSQSGCTCFGGGSQIVPPVCPSTWAQCDSSGELTKLYARVVSKRVSTRSPGFQQPRELWPSGTDSTQTGQSDPAALLVRSVLLSVEESNETVCLMRPVYH